MLWRQMSTYIDQCFLRFLIPQDLTKGWFQIIPHGVLCIAQYSAILRITCSRIFQYVLYPAPEYSTMHVSCSRILQSACILLKNIPKCVYLAPEYSTMRVSCSRIFHNAQGFQEVWQASVTRQDLHVSSQCFSTNFQQLDKELLFSCMFLT